MQVRLHVTSAQLGAIAQPVLLLSSHVPLDPLETPQPSHPKLAVMPALRALHARWVQDLPFRALLAPSHQTQAPAIACHARQEDIKGTLLQLRARHASAVRFALWVR